MRSRDFLKSHMVMALAIVLTLGTVGSTSTVFAADKKVADGKKAKPAKAKTADKAQSAWIKICNKVKIKEVKAKETTTKNICMTHHESLSAKTGTPLVAAAVRNVEGHKTERFLVTVPLEMAIPAGVHVKIDENEPLKFKYSFCGLQGCVAEMQMTEALMKQMKSGKKMMVVTIAISGKPIGFPIPLTGFNKAYAGKPIDSKKYANARRAIMMEIRKKRMELAKKQKADKLKNIDKKPVREKAKK